MSGKPQAMSSKRRKMEQQKQEEQMLVRRLKETKEGLKTENELNDQYMVELKKIEQEIEAQMRVTEELQQDIMKMQNESGGQSNQSQDQALEGCITVLLQEFLLARNMKETIRSKQSQFNEMKLEDKHKPGQEKAKAQDDQQKDDGSYEVQVREGRNVSSIRIQPECIYFADFRSMMALYFMVNEKQIFFTDQLGNILMFQMRILDQLYPPVYAILRNFKPTISVKIKKPIMNRAVTSDRKEKKRAEQSIEITAAAKVDCDVPSNLFQKKQSRRPKGMMDTPSNSWNWILKSLSRVKMFFENALFLSLLACFLVLNFDNQIFVQQYNIFTSLSSVFTIQENYKNPELDLLKIVKETSNYSGQYHCLPPSTARRHTRAHSVPHCTPEESSHHPITCEGSNLTFFFTTLERAYSDCLISNKRQDEALRAREESCLDYDKVETRDFGPLPQQKYNSSLNGYVWNLPLTSRAELEQSITELQEQEWLKYSRSTVYIIVNYFNAPSNMMGILKLKSLFVQPEDFLNYNSVYISVLPLSQYNDTQLFLSSFLIYIPILLLLIALFDFFGIYQTETSNEVIKKYKEKLEDIARKKKFQDQQIAKGIKIKPEEHVEEKSFLNDYWIFDLKYLYIVIKKPIFFEYLYILNIILIIIEGSISAAFKAKLKGQNVVEDGYLNFLDLRSEYEISQLLQAIIILFMMLSVIRFLGNWSQFLNCYGLIMIKFTSQGWFIILVLVYFFAISTMAWIISLQAQIVNHFDFIYVFLGLMRCTLNYGIYSNLGQLKIYETIKYNIVFQIEAQYIQIITIVIVNFAMFPMFSAMMTQFVHDTKEEASKKMQEMKEQVSKKN